MFAANFLLALAKVLNIVINILIWIIIARAVVSWFQPNLHNQLVRFLYLATEPFLLPIRRFLFRYLPPMGIDFSPMVAILILIFLQQFLVRSLFQLAMGL
jgi:YggT family protein